MLSSRPRAEPLDLGGVEFDVGGECVAQARYLGGSYFAVGALPVYACSEKPAVSGGRDAVAAEKVFGFSEIAQKKLAAAAATAPANCGNARIGCYYLSGVGGRKRRFSCRV